MSIFYEIEFAKYILPYQKLRLSKNTERYPSVFFIGYQFSLRANIGYGID